MRPNQRFERDAKKFGGAEAIKHRARPSTVTLGKKNPLKWQGIK